MDNSKNVNPHFDLCFTVLRMMLKIILIAFDVLTHSHIDYPLDRYSNLSKNKISSLEPGCFGNISSLLVLKINQNRLSVLPDKVFTLSQLQVLCVFTANE